jgi:hypothetical protein
LKKFCVQSGSASRARRLRLVLRWWVALFVGLAGCTSFKHLTTVTDRIPKAKECSECHVAIYQEWAQSDHAKAYVNPEFRRATNDYAFESCLSCHAPEPSATSQAPRLRASDREEGITCVCCHLDQGRLTGPIEPTGKVKPHPVGVRPEFYRSSGICGACHQGTFEEWNAAAGKKEICQQCHMNIVVRKVTQPTEGISHMLVAIEKTAILRRHDFPILGDYIRDKILTVRGQKKDSVLTLRVTNNLPHALPTGDFGFRVLDLEVIGVDGQGRRTVLDRRELAPELSTAIDARGMLTLDLKAPADTVKAVVSLRRRSYDQADILSLADVEISL